MDTNKEQIQSNIKKVNSSCSLDSISEEEKGEDTPKNKKWDDHIKQEVKSMGSRVIEADSNEGSSDHATSTGRGSVITDRFLDGRFNRNSSMQRSPGRRKSMANISSTIGNAAYFIGMLQYARKTKIGPMDYMEGVEVADTGLSDFIDLEYLDMNNQTIKAMVTPSKQANIESSIYRVPFMPRFWSIQLWYRIILVLGIYQALMTPLIISFHRLEIDSFQYVAIIVTSVLFSADVVISFLTCFKDIGGKREFDAVKVAKNYISKWFILDVLASIPMPLIIKQNVLVEGRLNQFQYSYFLALFNMIKFYKMFSAPKFIAPRNSIKWVFKKMVLMFVAIHWSAIAFFYATQHEESEWYEDQKKEESNTVLVQYSVYLHMVIQILTGKGSEYTTARERWFSSVLNIIGIVGQAYVLGEVSIFLHKLNERGARWNRKVESITESMENMRISEDLQQRVRNSYAFHWAINGSDASSNDWMDYISDDLKAEVCIHVNSNLIRTLPLFKDCNDFFILDVVKRLETKLFLPGDYVIRIGERGREMYFVIKGTLQALDLHETTVFNVLSEGMFFGEIALLQDEPRTATVRSYTYSECNVLYKESLDEVLKKHPQADAKLVMEKAAHRRKQNSTNIEKNKKRKKFKEKSSSSQFSSSTSLASQVSVVDSVVESEY